MGWAREPLVHFAVAGAVLFAAAAWWRSGSGAAPGADDAAIHITTDDVAQLTADWQARTGRDPTPDELRQLVADRVRAEILMRDALALGLHVQDHVVRDRLADVLTYAAEDRAAIPEPDDAALQAFLDAHADAYRAPDRWSVEQVWFDPAGRDDAATDAHAALATLQQGGAPSGDDPPGGASWRNRSEREVTFLFGDAFVQALRAAPRDAWSGPIESTQGWHCIRVTGHTAGALPPLADVRARLAEDWRAAQLQAARDADYAERRARYHVTYGPGVPVPE